jgi:hypothetical protein
MNIGAKEFMTNVTKSPMETLNNLVSEMIEKRRATLAAKINKYPRERFIASDIGDCDRAMVHSVLDWDKRPLHDEGLQALFDSGNREEESVKARMAADGWSITHQQTPFEIKNKKGEVMCRGKIDGKIIYNRLAIPWEVKSMDPNILRSITGLDDFKKKPHLRKYIRQMQLYLYGNNAEVGLFTLSDFRREKYIPVALDLGECEQILQRLERNWEHVKAKTYPDRMDYNDTICGRCPYIHICLPDIKNCGAKFIDNQELATTLDRREELKPLAKEYETLDKEVKTAFKNIPDAVVNLTWRIIGKATNGRATIDKTKIPPDILEAATVKEPGWTTSIIRLEQKEVKP